jgi:hypothetical protein
MSPSQGTQLYQTVPNQTQIAELVERLQHTREALGGSALLEEVETVLTALEPKTRGEWTL